ncbi:MAG: hypothetical protein IID61_06080 [SAR324 cluster bacterium]|nr:hypothetical protein [SAR324 cluster bacterium]
MISRNDRSGSRGVVGGIANHKNLGKRPDGRTSLFTIIMLSLITAAGCGGPLFSTAQSSGLPERNTAALSGIVNDSRAAHPGISAASVPHEPRTLSEDDPAVEIELALKGEGVAVFAGKGVDEASKANLELHLNKSNYAEGELRVTFSGEDEQIWPIIAFDLLGERDDEFEFIYVVSTPDSKVRYLAIIGGKYDVDDNEYVGYEGTLVSPKEGSAIEEWAWLYKIDFGYRYPVDPKYAADIEATDAALDAVNDGVSQVDSTKENIAETKTDLETNKAEPKTNDNRASLKEEKKQLEEQLESLEKALEKAIAETETAIAGYYDQRTAVSNDFAEFTTFNQYHWLDTDGKTDHFEDWQEVESLDEDMDELYKGFLPDAADKDKIKSAREEALEVIQKNDNSAKNPEAAEPTDEEEEAS